MAIQTVNIGAIVNDGTGDPLRTAYSKLNDNFTDTANAASKLVQTSPTDTTAGAIMAVGAFGLGADGITATGSLNNIVGQGFYGVIYTSVSDLPSDYPTTGRGALNVFRRNDASITQELYDARTPAKWVRSYYTTWSAWQRTDPQGFGYGNNQNQFIGSGLNPDDYITTGVFYGGFTSPTASTAFLVVDGSSGTRVRQTWYDSVSSASETRYLNGTWSAWQRTDPQAFGLGLDDPLNEVPITDLHDLSATTFTAYSSPDANAPTNLNGVVRFEARNGGTSSIRGYLYAVDSDGAHNTKVNIGGTWSAWEPVYTGANFQPEVRAGLNTKDVYFMVSGTVAVDATVSGSLLYFAKLNASGQYVPSTNSPNSATFKNLGVQSCTTTVPCTFVRQS